MNTWTPLFSKIVLSSVWAEPDFVRIVWVTMLALKDADQVVRHSAFALAKFANKDEAEVLKALKVLSSPDKKRLEPQKHDGRRIHKVDGGWLILNGLEYEHMMRTINRREYQRIKQGEYRANRRPSVPPEEEPSNRTPEEQAEIEAREMSAHAKVKASVQELNAIQQERDGDVATCDRLAAGGTK